jgi:hypothetical protein
MSEVTHILSAIEQGDPNAVEKLSEATRGTSLSVKTRPPARVQAIRRRFPV